MPRGLCYTIKVKCTVSEAWRVSGRVQGVGFRYFVMLQASQFGLVGWVANRRGGDVEVHASGTMEALRRFEAALKIGPPHSKVLAVTSVPPSQGLEGRVSFTIEYTMA
jgi:acylphosphatase